MKRSDREWRGGLKWSLSGLLLAGAMARGEPPLALADQLLDLGRQALAQGATAEAETFYRKVLTLDPGNANARRALDALPRVRRAALAGPVGDEVAAGPEKQAQATIESAVAAEDLLRQQLTADLNQRLQAARGLLNERRPEAALDALRLAQTVIRSAEQVDEVTRDALDRQVQAQILATVRAEERIVQERAEQLREQAAAEQQVRALDQLAKDQETVNTLMIQFDSLMSQGQYNVLANGGLGDVAATTAPFGDARNLAQAARALQPLAAAPRAGVFVSQTTGFLAQELAFEQIKEYRFMLTMQDVCAAVPFPDTQTIEYPPIDSWRRLSERRLKRYGNAVDLLDRDAKTKSILAKLEEPISMSFANETPLEDVLKYIKSATQGPNDNGIPIYVDPVGLNEAEKTLTSPVTLDLEGVPLKTTLRLLLKQLGMTYTVKDGLLTITSESSEDQPTEIRVYPVADLAIIPISLVGGGGGGGLGGGRGGFGGGGGLGGGIGGGGLGGGGFGGGGGGGFQSVAPVADPTPRSQPAQPGSATGRE